MTDVSIFDDDISMHTLKIGHDDTLVLKNTGRARWFKIEVINIEE